jgi:hypothetical protein
MADRRRFIPPKVVKPLARFWQAAAILLLTLEGLGRVTGPSWWAPILVQVTVLAYFTGATKWPLIPNVFLPHRRTS